LGAGGAGGAAAAPTSADIAGQLKNLLAAVTALNKTVTEQGMKLENHIKDYNSKLKDVGKDGAESSAPGGAGPGAGSVSGGRSKEGAPRRRRGPASRRQFSRP